MPHPENLFQTLKFTQIKDNFKERYELVKNNSISYDREMELVAKAEKYWEFYELVCKEWSNINEEKMDDDEKAAFLKGATKDTLASKSTEQGQKEAFLNGLREIKYENLLKVYERMGEDEWNQENMGKALKEIGNEEFELEELEKISNSWGFSGDGFSDDIIKQEDLEPLLANIIISSVDNKTSSIQWKEFEDALGYLKIDLLSTDEIDDDDEIFADINNFLYQKLHMIAFPYIKKFFKEWINTIHVSEWKSKEKFGDIIKKGKCSSRIFMYKNAP